MASDEEQQQHHHGGDSDGELHTHFSQHHQPALLGSGLGQHLSPEDALQTLVRALAPEDVLLDLLEVEQVDQLVECLTHEVTERSRQLLLDGRVRQ